MALIKAHLSFLEPWIDKKEAPYIRGKVDELYPRSNCKMIDHLVKIQDIRSMKDDFELDIHGFAFGDHESPCDSIIQAIREKDQKLVQENYYPHIESLIKQKTGAKKVLIFDHTYRRRDPSLSVKENRNGREQPATIVHCDQSTSGAIRRVWQHTGENAKNLLKGRVQIINVWHPLHGTVKDWPLAVMDYRSLDECDVHPTTIYKQELEVQGSTISINHKPKQRWHYLENHRKDEVTFIKIWDNKEKVARSKSNCSTSSKCKIYKDCIVDKIVSPHCAFLHPDAPANETPRESVEFRCLVFHDS